MCGAFSNLFASSQGSSQFPSISSVHQPVHQQQQMPTAPSQLVGATESLINKIQHNVSSCNLSPMRNQGVFEQSCATSYKVAYQQHAGKKRGSGLGLLFVKNVVMGDGSDENVPCGSHRQQLEWWLILWNSTHCGKKTL